MATLHVQGKVQRAKVLVDPAVPVYLLFTSDTTAETDSLVITSSTLLGAVRATKKSLLASGDVSDGSSVLINNLTYTEFDSSVSNSTLYTKKANSVYVHGILDTSVVAAGQTVKTVYVVSSLRGLTPSGLTPVSAATLQANFNNLTYVVEAVQVLAQGNQIVMSNTTNKIVGLVLEM